MRRAEAGKLLGGHATGTLTEAERKVLYAAALEDQALFDALMDEEALRELLADPQAKAQLLAALAAPAPVKVVPFWRRPGMLGAAAGVLMASLAGLTWLRNPQAPPPVQRELAAPRALPGPKVESAPAPPAASAPRARKAGPSSAPPEPMPAPMPAPTPASAPAPPAAPVAAEAGAVPSNREVVLDRAAPAAPAAAAVALREAESSARRAKSAEGGAALYKAAAVPQEEKRPRRVEWKAAAAYAPGWTLEPLADGTTRVRLKGPVGASAVLLHRRGTAVAVLPLARLELGGGMDHWQTEVRLAEGDALDLYLLNAPVAEPAKLPATGSVDGYRARIFPAEK